MGEAYILTVSPEILQMIASHLNIVDNKAFRRVNRYFRPIGTRELAKGRIVVLPAWHLIRELEEDCSPEFKNVVGHVSLPTGKWVHFETRNEWYEAAADTLRLFGTDNTKMVRHIYQGVLKLQRELEDDQEKVFKELLKLFPSLTTVELGQKVSGGTHYSQIYGALRCEPLRWNDDLGNESSL